IRRTQIAKLAGDDVLVPMALDCVSDQFLIAALTVSVRAVEKIYADLARAAQGLDRRISVGLIVERRHRRAAETDRGNLKPAESPPLHPSASSNPQFHSGESPRHTNSRSLAPT